MVGGRWFTLEPEPADAVSPEAPPVVPPEPEKDADPDAPEIDPENECWWSAELPDVVAPAELLIAYAPAPPSVHDDPDAVTNDEPSGELCVWFADWLPVVPDTEPDSEEIDTEPDGVKLCVWPDRPWTCAGRFPLDSVCVCLLYTSPSPRDRTRSRMPSSA